MGNSRYYQFLYSKNAMLTEVNGLITVGSTGAVSAATGTGVQGVTRLTTGIYKIKLVENFYSIIGYEAVMYGGITGSSVTAGSFVTGTLYQIITLGNTSWSAAGFDADYTAAVGSLFVATGAGTGTGTVKAIGTSGIMRVEMARSQSSMLQNNNAVSGKGSAFTIQTYNSSDALADPASGCQINFWLWLKNSSVSY